MSITRFRRQFSSGSRPAPDPYDKYLDYEGFYRKHTARDASCLFRVISEQVFDTQVYHEKIRMDCVDFMVQNRIDYEKRTPIEFDEYMCKMSKSTTFGTLLELHAIGFMYKRNILLYKPYDLGKWFIKQNDFTHQCIRVFYAPDKHFDSVYTKSHIVKAAFCQSIAYEILYKHVFKLPDIEYSVEMMLHSPNENENNKAYALYKNGGDRFASHIVLQDGRRFHLDTPGNTYCILDDYRLCHFHNPDFDNMVSQYAFNNTHVEDMIRVKRLFNASLPDKYISCVRQLINVGITPFPYKVAKALDPDIYRNTEFDSWNDYRKEMRTKCLYSDSEHFQVGVKCLVRLDEKQENLFKCHIQEMSPNKGPCIVFVEDLAEKHSVPYSFLQPLNDVKPWALSHYRYNRSRFSHAYTHTYSLRNERKTSHNRKHIVNDVELMEYTKNYDNFTTTKCHNLDEYTNLSNFYPCALDIVAMPLTINRSEDSSNSSNNNNSNVKKDIENYSNLKTLPNDQLQPLLPEQHQFNVDSMQSTAQPPPPPVAGGFYYFPGAEYAMPPELLMGPLNYYNYNCPSSAMQANSIYSAVPVNNWTNYNAAINGYVMPTTPNQCTPTTMPLNIIIRRKDLLSIGSVNFNAQPSYAPLGNDLPVHDKATLRFFYNMGHELFKYIETMYGLDSLLSIIDNENMYSVPDLTAASSSACTTAATADTDKIDNIKQQTQQLNLENSDFSKETPNMYHSANLSTRRCTSKFKKEKRNYGQHQQSTYYNQESYGSQPSSQANSVKSVSKGYGNYNMSKFSNNCPNNDGYKRNIFVKDNNNNIVSESVTNNADKIDGNNVNSVHSKNELKNYSSESNSDSNVTAVTSNADNSNKRHDKNYILHFRKNYHNNGNNGPNNYNIRNNKYPKPSYQDSSPQSAYSIGTNRPDTNAGLMNRDKMHNTPESCNYTPPFPFYAQQFLSMESNEPQPFYMPLNVYPQPGYQARGNVPQPIIAPREIIPESQDPYFGNYYSPYVYPPAVVPSAVQNFWYPPPTLMTQPPPPSPNVINESNNVNGVNNSNPSQ